MRQPQMSANMRRCSRSCHGGGLAWPVLSGPRVTMLQGYARLKLICREARKFADSTSPRVFSRRRCGYLVLLPLQCAKIGTTDREPTSCRLFKGGVFTKRGETKPLGHSAALTQHPLTWQARIIRLDFDAKVPGCLEAPRDFHQFGSVYAVIDHARLA
jgi:hypothetical protein